MANPHGFSAATNPAANAKLTRPWSTNDSYFSYLSAVTRSDSSCCDIAAVGVFTNADVPSEL